MPLWPHQTTGVAFALREKKVALWDDTGTGKTGTAIALADAIEAMSILVICPVIGLEHWKAQFAKHGRIDRSVALVRDHDAPLHGADVIVVPFSLISKYPSLAKRLRQYRFDLVVIDEAHALMSMDSERTRSIYAIGSESGGLQDRAPYVVLLSATLSPNGRPNELYTHLRALRPELLGPACGYDTFVARYCITKFGRGGRETIVGPNKQTAPELKRIMGALRSPGEKEGRAEGSAGGHRRRAAGQRPRPGRAREAHAGLAGVGIAARGRHRQRRPARRRWRWRDRARTRRPIAA